MVFRGEGQESNKETWPGGGNDNGFVIPLAGQPRDPAPSGRGRSFGPLSFSYLFVRLDEYLDVLPSRLPDPLLDAEKDQAASQRGDVRDDRNLAASGLFLQDRGFLLDLFLRKKFLFQVGIGQLDIVSLFPLIIPGFPNNILPYR